MEEHFFLFVFENKFDSFFFEFFFFFLGEYHPAFNAGFPTSHLLLKALICVVCVCPWYGQISLAHGIYFL